MSEKQPLVSGKMNPQQQPGYPAGQYPAVQPATYPGGQPGVYPGYQQQGAPPQGAPPPQGYGTQGYGTQGYPPQTGYPQPAGGAPGYPPAAGAPPPQQGGYPPSQAGGYPPPQAGGYPPPQGGGYPPPAQGASAPPQAGEVDEPTYKGDVPNEDVEVDPNAAQAQGLASPSAPPAEKMDHVTGYDTMNTPVPPPPSYQEAMAGQQPPQRQSVSTLPTVTEEQAREALLQFVSENCCFGKKAAQEMVFSDITHSSAFHYKVETFTEKRSTEWAFEPFRGQPIDGPANGAAPGPWDIQVQIPGMFKDSKGKAEVPHTASVKPCHDCHGAGRKRCHVCLGRGRTRCHHCHGSGRVMVHNAHHGGGHGGGHHGGRHGGHHGGHHGGGHHHSPCTWCHGMGRKRCHTCFGHGQVNCKTCQGAASLKFYIKLDIDWTNHVDDSVVERTALPEELIKNVTGEVAFKEEQPRVWPINHFPDPQINQASHQLVNKHVTAYRMEKIIMQRHQVRIIPVAEAHYQWKNQISSYFVYGFEHKVHAPDYPQQCCCGCTII